MLLKSLGLQRSSYSNAVGNKVVHKDSRAKQTNAISAPKNHAKLDCAADWDLPSQSVIAKVRNVMHA